MKVDLVSGSATGKDNHDILSALTDLPKGCEDAPPRLEMTFQNTVIPDDITTPYLISYLVKERRITEDQIALLVEGNTSYGRGLIEHTLIKTGKDKKELRFENVLVLPFPMALSRIRSEYERSEANWNDSAPEIPRGARRNLKLPLAPPPYASDVLPTFAAGTSAVTDLSLEQILDTISGRGIRAVGILGTDVLDRLFLAQQVRRHAPNVQLFMFSSDLLYVHADYASDLTGALIASTYPLFTRNQDWTRTANDRKELHFPRTQPKASTTRLLNCCCHSRCGRGRPQRTITDNVDCRQPPDSNNEGGEVPQR